MPKIIYVDPDGTRHVVDAPDGTSLMQAAVANGVEGVLGECGGSAMCATCHVYVDPADGGRLPELGADEDEMLDSTASPRTTASRLSCQLTASEDLDGLVVRLPEEQI
ncbi:2Fe-2S iron-sulfur cluster-binding protein [Frankia sp. QA3]|uniref:2Fe-2S iron-sulfur cluster-binding protein n=1 Tax=Frankia sp. QA3 TaxID=710111 RepID=UPI000269BF85|nr:2Fe-2S iron-sulfur cluster-binding protein [Frankia sp. QA3]EIV92870.1 ferredoxin [Frankia sp. QA3]